MGVNIRTGPSQGFSLVPANAMKKGRRMFRAARIQTLPGNEFVIRGRPSRRYSMNTNYAKIVTNEAKADAFDKKEKYLRKSKRRSAGTLSKVIIRTHNREYSERITEQDTLRRQNDRLAKQIKWSMLKLLKKAEYTPAAGRFVEYHAPKDSAAVAKETGRISGLVSQWSKQAQEFFPGEEFFLQKGPNNVAKKLSLKRIKFVGNNALQMKNIMEMLFETKILSRGEYVYLSGVVGKAVDVGGTLLCKHSGGRGVSFAGQRFI